jgi:hypothetical protein
MEVAGRGFNAPPPAALATNGVFRRIADESWRHPGISHSVRMSRAVQQKRC